MLRDPNNAELLLTLYKLRERAEVSVLILSNRRAYFGEDNRRTRSSTFSRIERFIIIILMDFNNHLLFKK